MGSGITGEKEGRCRFQFNPFQFQFSRSVMSDSLRPHEPQHARPSCPSPIPGVYPNSCPLSQWCHPTISFSAVPFSSCPQSFPTSQFFQISQLFASGGQSINPLSNNLFPFSWTSITVINYEINRIAIII